MARPSKPHRPITVRLEKSLFDKLNIFCEDSGQSKTTAVERALAMYIDDYYTKKEQLEEMNRQ